MVRQIIDNNLDDNSSNSHNHNYKELYDESSKYSSIRTDAQKAVNEANATNAKNENVQKQIDDLIINSGTSDAEVVQARGTHSLLKGRFEEIEDKRNDFNFSSNNSQPPKIGLLSNSYKLIRKMRNDDMEIFQKTSKGYLRYVFRRNHGGAGYGVNYELLRVVWVEHISDIMLFKRIDNPTKGNVTKTFDFETPHNSSVIRNVMDNDYRNGSLNYHPEGANTALEPYTIAPGESVSYNLEKPYNSKMNVAFFNRAGVTGDNDTVAIKINEKIVKEAKINSSIASEITKVELPETTSLRSGANSFEITIQNTSSNPVYLIAINLYSLSEYDGAYIDNFIAAGSLKHPFISNPGASDYALRNAEISSNFGSFHGGERSNRCDIMWRPDTRKMSVYTPFNDITVGDWCVVENFSIKQITILIERAYMHSNMAFNTDGTLQMNFSYQTFSESSRIPLIDFWTSLTCTDPNFTTLRQPVYMNHVDKTGHEYFKATDGFVIQENHDGSQELHIRFTRFNNEYIMSEQASSISRAQQYNKHYYAPIRGWRDDANPAAPDRLQFSKGLDFYVY